jgi:hypothetical protein
MLSLQNKKSFFSFPLARIFSIFDFGQGWIALLGIVILDSLWAAHSSLRLPSPWIVFGNLFFVVLLRFIHYWLPDLDVPCLQRMFTLAKKKFPRARLLMAAEYILLSGGISHATCILTYLACGLSYPLVDQPLNHIDHMMGFDWTAWFRWSSDYLGFLFLKASYYSYFLQSILFIGWFSIFSDKNRLYELFWILLIGVMLTTFVSGFFPAVGPVFAFNEMRPEFEHIQPLGRTIFQQVMAIKSGTNPNFAQHGMTGIITFPSFHTICAIAYAYSFRRTGFIGYGIILINILALISIPPIGNHYLTDMIAGVIIGLLSIAAVKMLERTVNRPLPSRA